MIPLGIVASARNGSPPPPTDLVATFLQSSTAFTGSNPHTFAAVNFGTPAADREIVIGLLVAAASSRSLNTVTIGGVAATLVGATPAGSRILAIYRAVVPSGASGDVVVLLNSSVPNLAIGVWHVTGGISGTTTAQQVVGTSPATAVVTGVAGGAIIAVGSSSIATTATWTNAAERFDIAPNGTFSGADATAVGSVSVMAGFGGGSSTRYVLAAALAP